LSILPSRARSRRSQLRRYCTLPRRRGLQAPQSAHLQAMPRT
jgi:hypothetical protein